MCCWKVLKRMKCGKRSNKCTPQNISGLTVCLPFFYQKYWDIVGVNVSSCVLQALNTGVMPRDINNTYICLILKIKNPQKITDYRPISLCNLIYKLISKVLANRLKKILHEVINEAQSAFVLRRHITDNVVWLSKLCIQLVKGKKGRKV